MDLGKLSVSSTGKITVNVNSPAAFTKVSRKVALPVPMSPANEITGLTRSIVDSNIDVSFDFQNVYNQDVNLSLIVYDPDGVLLLDNVALQASVLNGDYLIGSQAADQASGSHSVLYTHSMYVNNPAEPIDWNDYGIAVYVVIDGMIKSIIKWNTPTNDTPSSVTTF